MRKSIQKIILLLALFISIVVIGKTQVVRPKGTLGFNLIYAKPVGRFSEGFNLGVGAEVYGGVGWDKTFIIGTIAYRLFGDQWCFCNNQLEATTVKIGVKQFFAMQRLFVQGDIGIASLKSGGLVSTSFSPGIGAGVRLKKLELGLYYDSFKRNNFYEGNINAGSFNAKLGYAFSL